MKEISIQQHQIRWLALVTALGLSSIAAYFSIWGLTNIFTGAFWSVVIMGGALEIGKIVSVSWLYQSWNTASRLLKLYLCSAVVVIMLITSTGLFGFLSKSHLQVQEGLAQVGTELEQVDYAIQTQQDTINDSKKVLKQLDGAVQTLIDAQRIRGKDGSLAVREGQKAEREKLTKQIKEASNEIQKLRAQRATASTGQQALATEVGPLRYLAELVYGDTLLTADADTQRTIIERAVRYVIIAIVCVFDPLAIALLLAANSGFKATSPQPLSNKGSLLQSISNISIPRSAIFRKKK